jgi:hypothetical protein
MVLVNGKWESLSNILPAAARTLSQNREAVSAREEVVRMLRTLPEPLPMPELPPPLSPLQRLRPRRVRARPSENPPQEYDDRGNSANEIPSDENERPRRRPRAHPPVTAEPVAAEPVAVAAEPVGTEPVGVAAKPASRCVSCNDTEVVVFQDKCAMCLECFDNYFANARNTHVIDGKPPKCPCEAFDPKGSSRIVPHLPLSIHDVFKFDELDEDRGFAAKRALQLECMLHTSEATKSLGMEALSRSSAIAWNCSRCDNVAFRIRGRNKVVLKCEKCLHLTCTGCKSKIVSPEHAKEHSVKCKNGTHEELLEALRGKWRAIASNYGPHNTDMQPSDLDDIASYLSEYAALRGTSKCPSCGLMTKKTNVSCFHTKCFCGEHFCFQCEGLLSTSEEAYKQAMLETGPAKHGLGHLLDAAVFNRRKRAPASCPDIDFALRSRPATEDPIDSFFHFRQEGHRNAGNCFLYAIFLPPMFTEGYADQVEEGKNDPEFYPQSVPLKSVSPEIALMAARMGDALQEFMDSPSLHVLVKMKVFDRLQDHLGILEGIKDPFRFAVKLACDFKRFMKEDK